MERGESGERGERREGSSDGITEGADVGGTSPRGSLTQTPTRFSTGEAGQVDGERFPPGANRDGTGKEGRKEITEYPTYPKTIRHYFGGHSGGEVGKWTARVGKRTVRLAKGTGGDCCGDTFTSTSCVSLRAHYYGYIAANR